MQSISDNTLLDKVKAEESASFALLYKFYFAPIASYVKRNQGNNEDAEDIFQETVLVLLQKVREPDFVLTSSLKTYLYAISKNLWLKRLRDNKIKFSDSANVDFEIEPFEIEQEISKEEKVTSWLSKITENCQRILKAIFYYQEPMSALMAKMGWKNKHTAANQQYKCIQQIKKERQKEKGLD
ncbi:MAG: sigma-70 family RNA polymerase sigma factor [Cyclobacteriaceae bacterium]|jgi:RNA polymerase sigma factor (sigma-70 family)|nr:sigma-70 family RNA polymerase sigma factor [Cyclobacteriaceae bacterium]